MWSNNNLSHLPGWSLPPGTVNVPGSLPGIPGSLPGWVQHPGLPLPSPMIYMPMPQFQQFNNMAPQPFIPLVPSFLRHQMILQQQAMFQQQRAAAIAAVHELQQFVPSRWNFGDRGQERGLDKTVEKKNPVQSGPSQGVIHLGHEKAEQEVDGNSQTLVMNKKVPLVIPHENFISNDEPFITERNQLPLQERGLDKTVEKKNPVQSGPSQGVIHLGHEEAEQEVDGNSQTLVMNKKVPLVIPHENFISNDEPFITERNQLPPQEHGHDKTVEKKNPVQSGPSQGVIHLGHEEAEQEVDGNSQTLFRKKKVPLVIPHENFILNDEPFITEPNKLPLQEVSSLKELQLQCSKKQNASKMARQTDVKSDHAPDSSTTRNLRESIIRRGRCVSREKDRLLVKRGKPEAPKKQKNEIPKRKSCKKGAKKVVKTNKNKYEKKAASESEEEAPMKYKKKRLTLSDLESLKGDESETDDADDPPPADSNNSDTESASDSSTGISCILNKLSDFKNKSKDDPPPKSAKECLMIISSDEEADEQAQQKLAPKDEQERSKLCHEHGDKCSICLKEITRHSHYVGCDFHCGCYLCLCEWMKVVHTCHLCKTKVRGVIEI